MMGGQPREGFFDSLERRLILRGRIVTQTGLHIGAGGSLSPVGSDNPVVKDPSGRPFIPGSSIKGVVRSSAEAIVRAIQPGRGHPSGLWACNFLDPAGVCVPPEKVDEVRRRAEAEGRDIDEALCEELWPRTCFTCRLFGSTWAASKVWFKDAHLLTEAEDPRRLVETRTSVAIDRGTKTAAKGRLFETEVVPPGAAFDFELKVENASDEELGLLFLALDELSRGDALGGGKSRGLGRVRIEIEEAEEVTSENLLEYLRTGRGRRLSGEKLDEFKRSCVEAFVNFARRAMGGGKDARQTLE